MPEIPTLRPGKGRSLAGLILTAAALVSLFVVGYVHAHKEVTLVVDGSSRVVGTLKGTVAGLLEQEKVELAEGDLVVPAPDTELRQGMTVTVRRAVPVTIEAGGSTWTTKTAQETVGEALADLGIKVGPLDKVTPGLTEPVRPDQVIKVVKVEEKLQTRQEPIPYSVQRREDGDLPRGQTRVIQAGQEGLKLRQVRAIFEDGRLVKEEVVEEKVVRQPVTEIVAVGTLGTISRGGREYRYTRVLDMVATAYCPQDEGGNFTALGLPARRGVVAVDPRVIPLGTKLYVDGYGPAVAGDTGGAIKGMRIDLFVDSCNEAINFGRRRVKVYILKER
ncbi:MAG: hypothetical protein PWR11_730 [Bacillota bacterium]|jgi:3D (Asp-Asp-Asp) domain-containing protein|nr:hypothetical protein [Bacillota bacterium]